MSMTRQPAKTYDLTTTPPGPELAGTLAEHAQEGQGLRELVDHDLVEALRAAHRLGAWAAALELAAISELDHRRVDQEKKRGGSGDVAAEFVVDEIAAALAMTATGASIRAAMAWRLSGPLRDTWQALLAGLIDFDKARAVCDAVTGLLEADAQAVQHEVLAAAQRCTVGQLRALLRTALTRVAPEEQAERKQKAADSRRLDLWPTPEGTVDVSIRDLPEDIAHACYNRINSLAQATKTDGDARPIDQIRADIAVSLLRGLPWAGAAAMEAARQAEGAEQGKSKNQTTRAAGNNGTGGLAREVAAGVAEQVRSHLAEALAQVIGQRKARLAAHAGDRIRLALRDLATQWCGNDQTGELQQAKRADTDESGSTSQHEGEVGSRGGQPVGRHHSGASTADTGAKSKEYPGPGHGHLGYRPPAAMRRQIEQRDERCVFPSCRRPAKQCDLDHTIPYHRGGDTCSCNLTALCRHHHRTKQQPGWRLIQVWPGVLLWVTPAGQWYLTGPADTL